MQQVLAQLQSQDHLEDLVLLAHMDRQDSQDPLALLEFLVSLVLKVIREIKENRVLLLALVRLWLQREQKERMVLHMLVFLDHLVLLVPQGLLDIQVILDQVHRDHLENQAHQDMADLVLKETGEIQETLCLIQEHFLRDHQDLQGLREQQVPKVQEDTKGNKVNLAFQGVPVELSLSMVWLKVHLVPQDLLDYLDEMAGKGILEYQVHQHSKENQESQEQLQSGPKGGLVPQDLLVHLVLQVFLVDPILLQIIVITSWSICRVTA